MKKVLIAVVVVGSMACAHQKAVADKAAVIVFAEQQGPVARSILEDAKDRASQMHVEAQRSRDKFYRSVVEGQGVGTIVGGDKADPTFDVQVAAPNGAVFTVASFRVSDFKTQDGLSRELSNSWVTWSRRGIVQLKLDAASSSARKITTVLGQKVCLPAVEVVDHLPWTRDCILPRIERDYVWTITIDESTFNVPVKLGDEPVRCHREIPETSDEQAKARFEARCAHDDSSRSGG